MGSMVPAAPHRLRALRADFRYPAAGVTMNAMPGAATAGTASCGRGAARRVAINRHAGVTMPVSAIGQAYPALLPTLGDAARDQDHGRVDRWTRTGLRNIEGAATNGVTRCRTPQCPCGGVQCCLRLPER